MSIEPCSPRALNPIYKSVDRRTRRNKYREAAHAKPPKPRKVKDTRTLPEPTPAEVHKNPRAGLCVMF